MTAKINMNRDKYLDFICGILILRMIAGHFASASGIGFPSVLTYLFCFFMPWFYFKSGMFHRAESCFKDDLYKNIRKLIYPYVLWSVIGLLCECVTIAITHGSFKVMVYRDLMFCLTKGATSINAALWFLLSLFLVKTIWSIFRDRLILVMAISLMLAFAHHYLLSDKGIWILGNVFIGVIYYGCGYYLKEKQFNNSVFIFSLVASVFLLGFFPNAISFFDNAIELGSSYVLALVTPIPLIIVANNFAFRYLNSIPDNPISFIGRNSIYIYISHFPLCDIIPTFFNHYGVNISKGWLFFLMMLLAIVIFLLLVAFDNRETKRETRSS